MAHQNSVQLATVANGFEILARSLLKECNRLQIILALQYINCYLFAVNVKWGKEKFKDVECNTDEMPLLFKAQLFTLSGVSTERQKVMIKGATIKVCSNSTLFLLGNVNNFNKFIRILMLL